MVRLLHCMQMTYTSLQGLGNSVVAATLGVNATDYDSIKASTPKGTFIPRSDPDCLARCKLAPALAPSTQVQSQSISASG